MKHRSLFARRSLPVVVAGFLALTADARGGEFDFLPDSGTWSDPNAWTTPSGPQGVPTAGDDAVFGANDPNKTYTITANGNSIHNILTGAAGLNINLAGNLTASGTLNGRSVTLTGSGTLSADTISLGQFSIGGGVTVNANSAFQSAFTLTMTGGSSLTTNGDFSGNQVQVSGGSSIMSESATINGNFGDSTLAGGSTWNVGGLFTSDNTYTLTISSSSTLTCLSTQIAGSASVTVDGGGSAWKIGGDAAIQSTGGGMDAERGGAVSIGGNLTVNNVGAVFANQNDTTGASRIDVTGKVDVDSGGTISVGQNATFTSAGVVTRASAPDGGTLVYGAYLTVNGTWTNTGGFVVGESGQNTAGYANDLGVFGGGTLTTSGNLVVGQGAAFNRFEVDSGGTVLNVNGTLAQNAGSRTDASVQGGTWTNSGTLTVGDGGTATLSIGQFLDASLPPVSGTVKNTDATVGNQAGSNGSVTVSGAGLWTVNGNLTVGAAGMSQGSVYVGPGGQLNVTGPTITLGRDAGSTGSLTLDNFQAQGTEFTFAGNLQVGLAGTGTLAVVNGFQLDESGKSLVLGIQATANGTLRVSDDYAQYGLPAATPTLFKADTLTVGSYGTGTLTIANNGQVQTTGNAIIADMAGSYGTATISGAGSKWQVGGSLVIGESGGVGPNNAVTTVTVSDSGNLTVNGPSFVLGQESGSQGTLVVDGPFATVNGAGATSLEIGRHGIGTLQLQNGAQFTIASTTLGAQSDGEGRVFVDGASNGTPTTLTVNGTLTVGGASAGVAASPSNQNPAGGELLISNGALVTLGTGSAGGLIIGRDAGATGLVGISGTGSLLQVNGAGSVVVGQDGTGTFNVAGGAHFYAASLVLGQNAGSVNNTLTLIGSGGTNDTGVTVGGTFTVGDAGSGTVSVQSGATLSTPMGSAMLGSQTSSRGTVSVTGTGSQWNAGDNLDIGNNGQGQLNVAAGGKVVAGTVFVGGKGLGFNGTGGLMLDGTNGASSLTAMSLFIGNPANASTGVTVTGTGAQLTISGPLEVGSSAERGTPPLTQSDSAGSLTVGSGAMVNAQGSVTVASATGTSAITVGGGATLTAPSLVIGGGSGGQANVTVNAGGSVHATANPDDGSSALLVNANGTLTVQGSGASAQATTLTVNDGTLNVMNGGHNSIGYGLVISGEHAAAATVTDSGSQLSAQTIEVATNGSLTATNGGQVTAGSNLTLRSGKLNVTNGGQVTVGNTLDVESASTGASTVSINGARIGAGSVTIGYSDQASLSLDNGGHLSVGSTLTVNGSGGLAFPTKLSTGSGSIDIGAVSGQAPAHTINIGAGGSLKALGNVSGNVTVQPFGSFGGSGTIFGKVTNGGLLAPGDPQTLTIDGNYTQTSAGSLEIAIAGADPAQMDHLTVTGEASLLGGTLELDFINGFAPKTGEIFDFLSAASLDKNNDTFGSVDITGLAPGFQYNVQPDPNNPGSYELMALNNGIATTVPEPGTWALLLLSASGLHLVVRWRTRRTAV